MATLIAAIVVLVAVLATTKAGRDIDAATQHFMLYYAGVLALVGLTGSVLLGLVATDRIVMTPGHRVMAQAVHRAFSFGTLAFLVIHIVTEILAQRSHVIDAVVPFLSPYRTFYIGLGTIASDLIVLLVVTSILRKRFTGHGQAWRWRAIHYGSYVAFVFGVLHGLLGGRTAKPYVDWSYGFAIAVTALGLAVRFLAISLRPKESLGSSPSVDRATAGSSPLRAAAMSMAQAQLGGTVQVLPAGLGGPGLGGRGSDSWAALPAPGWSAASGPFPGSAASGPFPALDPAPAYAGPPAGGYRDLGFTPLGAPPYGDDSPNGMRGRPYVTADQSRPALAGPARQPRYEPGYDGPPRFEGAPRGHGDIPRDELSSYPYGPQGRQLPPRSCTLRRRIPGTTRTAPDPTRGPGRARAARSPRVPGRPYPRRPARATGAQARCPSSGPAQAPARCPARIPARCRGSARASRRAMARARCRVRVRVRCRVPIPVPCRVRVQVRCRVLDCGPMPRAGTGPMPRADSGPMPRPGTGPMPRLDSGPMPRPDAGGMPRPDTGPMPRVGPGQRRAMARARCRVRVRVRCRVLTPVPCRVRVRVRCPGLIPAGCPVPTLARRRGQGPGRSRRGRRASHGVREPCRSPAPIRRHGPTPGRCRAWVPADVPPGQRLAATARNRSHASPRSADAARRPGYRAAHRPDAQGGHPAVTPGQAR